MPDPSPTAPVPLAQLREEIDRIDEGMHRLLMERGQIIDTLVAVKRSQGTEGSSAFRPAREAAMMRHLVDRHRGLLPVDTVEGIWRVIISTFTYVQAPYAVHADVASGEAVARSDKDATALADVVRFLGSMVQANAPAGSAAAITSLVQSLDIKADGHTVKLALAIPEEQVESVLASRHGGGI